MGHRQQPGPRLVLVCMLGFLMLTIVALWYMAGQGRDARLADRFIGPTNVQPEPKVATAPLEPNPVLVDRVEAPAVVTILVKDGSSGIPIAGAEVLAAPSRRLLRAGDCALVGIADVQGSVRMTSDAVARAREVSNSLLVRAGGYVSERIELPAGQATVTCSMHAENSVIVTVRDAASGEAMGGVLVIVGAGSCPVPLRELMKHTRGSGMGPDAGWRDGCAGSVSQMGVTDANGIVAIRGLAKGLYYAQAFADGWWTAPAEDARLDPRSSGLLELAGWGQIVRMEVQMRELFGACIKAPAQARVLATIGTTTGVRFALSAAQELIEQSIRSRHDNVVWTAFGWRQHGATPQAKARCYVDGQGWQEVEMEMVPLGDMIPKELAVAPRDDPSLGASTLMLEIIDATGARIIATDYLIRDLAHGFSLPAVTGVGASIPPGDYEIDVPQWAWLRPEVPRVVHAAAASPTNVSIELSYRLRRVSVSVTSFDGLDTEPMSFIVTGAEDNRRLMRMTTARKSVDIYVPMKDGIERGIGIGVSAAGLQARASIAPEQLQSAMPLEVAMVLKPK